MEIMYTYRGPEDRPIEVAKFRPEAAPEGSSDWNLFVEDHGVCFFIPFGAGNRISKSEWNDFTTLVNRINRQINGKEPDKCSNGTP